MVSKAINIFVLLLFFGCISNNSIQIFNPVYCKKDKKQYIITELSFLGKLKNDTSLFLKLKSHSDLCQLFHSCFSTKNYSVYFLNSLWYNKGYIVIYTSPYQYELYETGNVKNIYSIIESKKTILLDIRVDLSSLSITNISQYFIQIDKIDYSKYKDLNIPIEYSSYVGDSIVNNFTVSHFSFSLNNSETFSYEFTLTDSILNKKYFLNSNEISEFPKSFNDIFKIYNDLQNIEKKD